MKFVLTPREEQVLKLIIDENTNSEMAEKLCLSPETIKSHRKKLLRKFKARNSVGLVRRFFEYRLQKHRFILSNKTLSFVMGCFLCFSTISFGQQLEVEGHGRIRGNLDINLNYSNKQTV